MKNHIFISYSRKDIFFAEYLERVLKEETTFKVWRDYKIEGGDDWAIEIDNALNESFTLLVIVSPDSNKSPNVIYEWGFAMGSKIRVIPVLFHPFDENDLIDMQYKLMKLQRIDLSRLNSNSWKSIIQLIISAYQKNENTKVTQVNKQHSHTKQEINELISVLREERSGLMTRKKTLLVEGSEMNERISMLDNINSAICPLCEQSLTIAQYEKMLEVLILERDTKQEEYRAATERIAEIADTIPSLMSGLEGLNNDDK